MSTEKKKDWFIELGLVGQKPEILEWGRKTYPHYSNNENMMAQMWWTQHEGKLLPEPKTVITIAELRKRVKAFVDADDLVDEKGKPRKAWGNIEVLVVGPLGDSKPYFGCERCTRSIDKNIGICLNDDSDYGHAGEQIDGKMISWQNWQVGDGTDEAIISFAPNNKQTPHHIQGRVIVLAGSMNVRDGRYSVWEIVANKTAASPGGSGENVDIMIHKKPAPVEIAEEVVLVAETVDEESPAPAEELSDDEGFFTDAVEETKTETGATLKDRIPDYEGLLKGFKNSLERHVGTKKLPAENLRKFLEVRPQLRGLPDCNELAALFLEEMQREGLINIDAGDFLTRA
jgi:hypothetical protein